MSIKVVRLPLLRSMSACGDGLELFAEIFPQGAEATLDNLHLARSRGLPVSWFISRVNSGVHGSSLYADERTIQARRVSAVTALFAEYIEAISAAAAARESTEQVLRALFEQDADWRALRAGQLSADDCRDIAFHDAHRRFDERRLEIERSHDQLLDERLIRFLSEVLP